MRITSIAAILVLIVPNLALADTITAKVNGMVCAFCASGIEKSFKAQPEVSDVKVDLEQKLVTINTKPDQTLNDERVTKVITDAGYSVDKINRENGHETAK